MNTVEIDIKPSYDISPFLNEGSIVAFNVSYADEILVLIARNELDYQEEQKEWAVFPKAKPERAQSYEIIKASNGILESVCVIRNEKFNIHDVQFLPKEKLLLICSRSQYNGPNDFEKNGRLYSISGEFVGEILLGDGIQNTQVSPSGNIWTSYFDEGIFGNYGWNDPVGASGLASWNSAGEMLYEFSPSGSLDEMCDCYAINVSSEDVVWCYYYTEFPLVKINKGQINDHWEIPISGSDAFAVDSNYALFRGGYDEKEFFYLFELKAGHLSQCLGRFYIPKKNGIDLNKARVVGRKDKIYLLNENKIYSLSVGDAFVANQC